MDKLIKISVIGGNRVTREISDLAFEVGREIAKKKALLICGGMGGVMEAACKGARSEGGMTLGILPTDDEDLSNDYLDIRIPTGLGFARNALVVLAAHSVIAIDGKSGTLSEIGFAFTYKKPVIGLNTWRLIPSSSEEVQAIIYAKSPVDAVSIAVDEAKKTL